MFSTIKRMLTWIGTYKKRLFLGTVCSFFSSFTIVSPTMLAAWTFGKVVNAWQNNEVLDVKYIWYSILGILFFILIRFLFTYWRALLQESIGYEKVADERLKIGEVLKKVSLGYFTKIPTGEILTGLTTQLSILEISGMKIIDTVVNGYIQLFAVLLFLVFISPLSAVIATAGTIISYLALSAINRRTRRKYDDAHKAEETMAGSILEFIHGLPIIKSFGKESGAMENYINACHNLKDIRIDVELGFMPIDAIHMLALKMASVLIVFVCSLDTLYGEMTIGMYLMFVMFSFTIFSSVEEVNDSSYLLGTMDAALDKLQSLKKEDIIDKEGRNITTNKFDIEFSHVSFGYDSNREIIKDVSFKIPEGSVTAIVGPSGSGKTTLCNLIARFYDVSGGQILVGGKDVRDYTCDSLLKNISMVFQNVYLFEDTIRNNICFGKDDATEEEMIQAAKAARCHDFITALPNGYDTVIGEGGSSLSGGEKQRISIARAILKDAPIVILDEATASIDPENEHLIQAAISALTEGKTIIAIAHRIATIENADQILVLDKGKIVQSGIHKNLVKREGIYQKFVEIRKQAEGWRM